MGEDSEGWPSASQDRIKKCQEKRVYSKKRKELYLWLYGHLCQVSNKPPCWTNWSYLGSSLSRSVSTKLHINEQRRYQKSPNNITPLYDCVINQSIHQNSTINFFVSLEMFIMQWKKNQSWDKIKKMDIAA